LRYIKSDIELNKCANEQVGPSQAVWYKSATPTQVIEVHPFAGEYQKSRYKEGELLVLNPKRVKIFKNQTSSHNSLNV
jgi:hypothetical protein